MQKNEDWTPLKLRQVSDAYWKSMVIHSSVDLEIFNYLEEKGQNVRDLSRSMNLSERGLFMLLDALYALDLLDKNNDEYSLTDFSRQYLVKGNPDYIGFILKHHKNLVYPWSQLSQAVREGKPQTGRVAKTFSESERENFLMGMFNIASQTAPMIAKKLSLKGVKSLLDLGGGPGTYAIHFALENPEIKTSVFDLKTSESFALKTIERFHLSQKVDFIAGDFILDSYPTGYDVIWLSQVLHGEGPQHAEEMLANSAKAVNKGGQVIVHEFMLNDDKGPVMPALFSLNMLVVTEMGQAYREGEIRDFMKKAGLKDIEKISLGENVPSAILRGFKN